MARTSTNDLSDTLHCAAGCGHTIRLGQRMADVPDSMFNLHRHYPECPPPGDCGCVLCQRQLGSADAGP